MTPRQANNFGPTTQTCGDIPSPLGRGDVVFVPSQGLTALKRQPSTSAAEVLWKSSKLDLGQRQPHGRWRQGVRPELGRRDLVRLGGRRRSLVAGALRGSFWTTPVLAGGHLYCVNRDGLTSVVRLSSDKKEAKGRSRCGEQTGRTRIWLAGRGGRRHLRPQRSPLVENRRPADDALKDSLRELSRPTTWVRFARRSVMRQA